MARVTFPQAGAAVDVPLGTLLSEAAALAGVEIAQPCGGQGRCGRCAVQVTAGAVRRRSTLRLTPTDLAAGYALACQTVVEGDVQVTVPPQEQIARRLTSDRTVAAVQVPAGYDPQVSQSVRRVNLTLNPPTMDDQTDDLSRLQTALRAAGLPEVSLSLGLLRRLPDVLRQEAWQVTATLEAPETGPAYLLDLQPGLTPDDAPLWGAAVDIGTTTVTLWLVDLISGKVVAQASEYNGQIARGEDVISRIVFAGKNGGAADLQGRVLATIDGLLAGCAARVGMLPAHVVKMTIAGNSTMIHLLLGVPAAGIRLSPFVTAFNAAPRLCGRDFELTMAPDGVIDLLPGVASYVGSDITAGVLAAELDTVEPTTLFMDVGTNGEVVLGNREWLVTCACSAGPAFEGAGVGCGMRATRGAIEEVWIDAASYTPSCRVIGGGQARGICGSGLISLLAELFITGVVDKAGHLNTHLETPRLRLGESGLEYVVVSAEQSATGEAIVINNTDIDNLLRTKAAIYAGYTVLAEAVGVGMEAIERMLIGGSFGKYINVEKALQIGLLPDLPWDRFEFLGNTAVKGAYAALLSQAARARLAEIAQRMTYIELSADNSFYEAFMSALFLPHTDLARFPTVAAAMPQSNS